jgi:hypothetical protein
MIERSTEAKLNSPFFTSDSNPTRIATTKNLEPKKSLEEYVKRRHTR